MNLEPDHFLYAISRPLIGPVKVGISNDPTTRLQSFQDYHPYKLEVVKSWKISYEGAKRIERIAHHHMADCRLMGEWFDANPDTVVGYVSDVVRRTNWGREFGDFAYELSVKEVSRQIGGQLSGAQRAARAKAAAETIRAEWRLPSADYPTRDLLAKVGLSRNTVKLYLGPRDVAQKTHQASLKRAETKRIKNDAKV